MGRSIDGPGAFASLKPALLARKGAARPAMRQQLAALEAVYGEIPEDDLGWNDFGPEADDANRVVSITSGSAAKRAAKAAPKVSGAAAAQARGDRREGARKAAFTLRLDPERHLRLRLACALDARSAQALVTDALDRLLAAMPDLEPLASDAASQRAGQRASKPRSAKA
ncbi:hypothetical protein ACFOD9_06325 [Novosphingobium bradum]|uniref:Uncharacterized protein n=1 Tax=Novosphingobium bradum TaxID=1737444 RepID=A0ABV7ISH1_9SPHN